MSPDGAGAALHSARAVQLRSWVSPAAPGVAQPVLHGLDLQLARGEQVALIGPSGAGKTALLLALSCAVAPHSGTLELWGEDPWRLGSAARHRLRARLGLAPQTPPLPPRQRVVSAVLAGRLPQMSLWAGLRMLWHPREAPLAYAALQALDLGEALWQRVDRLSGGERQRVGLARLMVSQAELWLVDEPLSALDPARLALAIAALQAAAASSGRTLVCSLHQVDVARVRFGRIVALREGRIVYDGPPGGLSDEAVRALYTLAPSGPAVAEGHRPRPPDAASWPIAPTGPESATTGLPAAMCR